MVRFRKLLGLQKFYMGIIKNKILYRKLLHTFSLITFSSFSFSTEAKSASNSVYFDNHSVLHLKKIIF